MFLTRQVLRHVLTLGLWHITKSPVCSKLSIRSADVIDKCAVSAEPLVGLGGRERPPERGVFFFCGKEVLGLGCRKPGCPAIARTFGIRDPFGTRSEPVRDPFGTRSELVRNLVLSLAVKVWEGSQLRAERFDADHLLGT